MGMPCDKLRSCGTSRLRAHDRVQFALRRTRSDPFGMHRDTFETGNGKAALYRLPGWKTRSCAASPSCRSRSACCSNRCCATATATKSPRTTSRTWPAGTPRAPADVEVPFKPARVVLQDFTGVPCVVDLAAMRSAMQRLGRRSEEDQSADSGRSGDRPLGAGRLLRHDRLRWSSTSNSNSSAIASATSSCAGARRRSTISASCRRPSASCIR